MKQIFFLLVICIGGFGAFAQSGFFVKNNHIEKWYKEGENLEIEVKKAIALPEFQALMNEYMVKEESLLPYFHFIDFNNNGELDILFDGKMSDQNFVFIFLKKGNSYLIVLEQKGTIIQTNLSDKDNNLNLSIWNGVCCGEYISTFSRWVCITENNATSFSNAYKSLIFKGTLFPSTRIKAPVKCIVTNPTELRIEPRVDNQRRISGMTGWEGNSVCRYPVNATGTIYAEMKDDRTNKFWYFVCMNNESGLQLHSDRFLRMKEVEDVQTYCYYGWICSDDVNLE